MNTLLEVIIGMVMFAIMFACGIIAIGNMEPPEYEPIYKEQSE